MKKLLITFIICSSVLFISSKLYSQTTRTSTGTGNWGTAGTWSPGGVPAANDPVIIANGHNVTVNTAAVCASLTINGGGTATTLTISGTNSLTVSGTVTINAPSANYINKIIAVGAGTFFCASITMATTTADSRDCRVTISTGTLTVSGNITMNGTAARNQVTFTGAGTLYIGGSITGGNLVTVTGCTVNYNGTGPQTIYKKNYTGNLICSGSGTKTCSPNLLTDSIITVSGNVTVKTGSELKTEDILALKNSITQLTVSGTFTVEAGALVNVGGIVGGRLVVTGTGKTHSISGTVNIYWALRFDYPSGTSTSTVTVNSGAFITNDSAASGQFAIQNGVAVTFAAGSNLWNRNAISLLSWTGVYLNSNGKLTINGIFTNGIYGCIYIANANALTINGTFNYPSATWGTGTNSVVYGAGGTLVYTTGGSINTSNNEWPAASGPTKVIVSSIGNITMHAARTISGTLTLQQGHLVNGIYLTLGNGATVIRSGGTISEIPTFTTNCNVIYSNTNDITSGPELPPSTGTILNNLTMQSASDKTVTLAANATVKGTLTLTSGNIATGTYILTLGTGTGNTGTLLYSLNPIDETGIISGNFKRWFSASSTTLTKFPVGDVSIGFSTGFYPKKQLELTFSSIGTGGSVTVKYVSGDPHNYNVTPLTDPPYPFNIDTYCKMGFWNVSPGDGLSGYSYSINIYPTGANGANNPAELRVLKRASGSNNPWAFEGSHSAGSGPMPDLKASRTGLNSFSEFALGGAFEDGNPLDGTNPVELASFTSNVTERDVKLNWVTVSESNNSGFEVERAEVGSQKSEFRKISFVSGNGTKGTPTHYTFEDKRLNSGRYNYRLKQIDFNGNFEYFDLKTEVEIGVPGKFEMSQNYPNPFNPTTKIDFDLPYDSKVSIRLYDMSGREVMTILNEQKPAGYYTVQLNGNNLSSGTYFYRIIAEGNGQNYVMTKKMVLVK